MDKNGPNLEDLIDAAPLLEAADGLVSRCRDAAESADRYGAEEIRDWAVERYGAHDDLVRKAMNALFARDCAWGVADLDHPVIDRYAWELAAEICDDGPAWERYRHRGWLYPVGRFESCGDPHEVLVEWWVPWRRETPRLLVRRVHIPSIPGVHVGLFEPVYAPGWHRRWQFDDRHRDDFAAFMEAPAEGGGGWTHWDLAADAWVSANPDPGEGAPWEHRLGEVPDYRRLHWPGEGDPKEGERTC